MAPLTKHRFVRVAAQLLTTHAQRERVARMPMQDEGHGVDAFGMNREWVTLACGLLNGLYDHWFRVTSKGHEHIPPSGPTLVAANHSGTLPFDAMMLWADIVRKSEPPRVARSLADHFVPNLPFFSTLFVRGGTVAGSRGNTRRLLEQGELVTVFPEGTPGIGKPFRERYHLQDWRVGHVELALRHRAPVVPTAIIGAEEQMPQVARIEMGSKLFGAPYLPIPLTPIPLPVHYYILYGPALYLHDEFDPSHASEPEVLRAGAARVKNEVQRLLDQGLRERKGVFR